MNNWKIVDCNNRARQLIQKLGEITKEQREFGINLDNVKIKNIISIKRIMGLSYSDLSKINFVNDLDIVCGKNNLPCIKINNQRPIICHSIIS